VVHLGAIMFIAAESLLGIACPLTVWEYALRGQPFAGGFIERWIDQLLFYDAPPWVFTVAYVAFCRARACNLDSGATDSAEARTR